MPELMDAFRQVSCYRCDRRFIAYDISRTTATVRCPSCNHSFSLLDHQPPPPPPPPTPYNGDDENFDEFDEEDDYFHTTVEADQYEPHPTPAATSFINFLKNNKLSVTQDVLKQINTLAPSTCVICSDDFELEESVNKMECGHSFHSECITKWLNVNYTCPLCRYEFPREPDNLQQQPPESSSTDMTWENSLVTPGRRINLVLVSRSVLTFMRPDYFPQV